MFTRYDWNISCTHEFLSSFFLSSMVTDEGSLNVCAGAGRGSGTGAGRGCSHCTGAGSCRRRRTGRKMTVVVEVTTRG